MPRRTRRPTSILVLVCSLAGLAPSTRAAAQVFDRIAESSGSEALYFDLATIPQYQYRLDANGEAVPAIRLGQWASLATRPFAGERVRVVLDFRYDLDTSATPQLVTDFPHLALHRFSLLSGYLEIDAAKDVSIRLGRQLYADMADFLAFDGVRLGWKLPVPVRLELYGGVRSSVGTPTGYIASNLYELDGVESLEGLQPTVGATLRWTGDLVRRRYASVGFRQTWRSTEFDRRFDPALPEGFVTETQELVASAEGDVGPVHLSAGAAYSLALLRLMRARAAVTHDLGEAATVGLEYQRYQPTFALNSIWNFFAANAFDELGATAVWRPGRATRFEARAFGRLFHQDNVDYFGNEIEGIDPVRPAVGVRVGGVQGLGATMVDAWLSYQDGYGGRRALLDSGVRHRLLAGVDVYARVTALYFVQDGGFVVTPRSGPALGIIAGATWRLPMGAGLSLLVEENLNAYASPIPRVLGVVDLARWL